MGRNMLSRTVSGDELADAAEELLTGGLRLSLVAAHDDGDALRVVYLFLAGRPQRRVELKLSVPAANASMPSLAYLSFPAGRFEREMADLFGIVPVGHPRPRRLVRHAHWPRDGQPMRGGAGPGRQFAALGGFPFLIVDGRGVYEIGVGLVHAGLIEPGHFRFSVVGESVLRLKVRLWFVHRGIEKLFEGRAASGGVELAERISGDTSAAHVLAHCHAVEDALGVDLPDRAHRLRALLVELERLYNHVTDLGALANDVGFALANAHTQHIREQLLRINARATGHRLLRDAIAPGGVALQQLPDPGELQRIAADVAEITALTLHNSVIFDRFADTAVLSRDDAAALGCLGYVARASGISTDARLDHPITTLAVREATATAGDVLARYTLG